MKTTDHKKGNSNDMSTAKSTGKKTVSSKKANAKTTSKDSKKS